MQIAIDQTDRVRFNYIVEWLKARDYSNILVVLEPSREMTRSAKLQRQLIRFFRLDELTFLLSLVAILFVIIFVALYFPQLLPSANPAIWVAASSAAFACFSAYVTLKKSLNSSDQAAVTLLMQFMSIEFHNNVRSPAWYCMAKSRDDLEYRRKLLTHLSGDLLDSRAPVDRMSKIRRNEPLDEEEEQFHHDSHRLQDIIWYFTALSVLNSRTSTILLCNFYYDSWRVPLHKLNRDFADFIQSPSLTEPLRSRAIFRQSRLENLLKNLDRKFNLTDS